MIRFLLPSFDGKHPMVAQLMDVDNDSFSVRTDEPDSYSGPGVGDEEFIAVTPKWAMRKFNRRIISTGILLKFNRRSWGTHHLWNIACIFICCIFGSYCTELKSRVIPLDSW
jgi:hypothetical protein